MKMPAASRPFRAKTALVITAVTAIAAAWGSLGGWGPTHPGLFTAAKAQGAAAGPSQTALCAPGPGRLGVSRVVEIDTTGGPRFGLQQYHDNNFLQDGEVVLTFDDGPLRRHSRMVLDALAAHCTQATFYMVGQMAVADPEMVREIARAGHTIAIHTWSHKNLRAAGSVKATQEIELGISAVQRALGQPVAPFFRFPYLADSQAMLGHLSQRNFGVFSIDVDSSDFRTKDPRKMQRTILDGLTARKKGILLFHDIQFSTAHGIRGVLDELARRNFKIVHVVSRGQAVTQPSYDAMADAELTRRKTLAAAQPLATRAVVWPMTPPGVPVERYTAQTAHTSAAARGAPVRPTPAVVTLPRTGGGTATAPSQPWSATAQPATAVPAPAAVPSATVPPAPQVQPQPAPPATERPSLRGSNDEDWKQRAFGN